MKAYQLRDYVVVPDGRIGMVDRLGLNGDVSVKLGADGPFWGGRVKSLRLATKEEINYVTGQTDTIRRIKK